MLNKSWFSRTLLLSAMSVALTACGGGGGDDGVKPLQCAAPKVLNEAKNACITPETEAENTAPTFTSSATLSVEEATANGTLIYTAYATDAESNTITYSLLDPKSAFTINPATGAVTVDNQDNLIASNSAGYTITITATDNGSPAKSTDLVIAVTITEAAVSYPQPAVKPSESQGVVYYYRADGDYTGFVLHAWNNETCNAYAQFEDPGASTGTGTEWTAGLAPTDTDENYGVYWLFDTKDQASCANFIVHKGDLKDPDSDQQLSLNGDRWVFVVSDVGVFTDPADVSLVPPFQIKDASAHWLNKNTIVWNGTSDNAKLLWSLNGDLDDNFTTDNSLELTKVEFPNSLKEVAPHLVSWQAYQFEATAAQQEQLVKSQLVLTSLDGNGEPETATYVQKAKAFDDIYTSDANDADEQRLGLFYNTNGNIELDAWAPSAQSLQLKVFNAAKELVATHDMIENKATGVWHFETDSSMNYDRLYYRFAIQVYHPLTKKVEDLWVTDPYSVNTSTNGRYSQFVNMTDADLYPAGWQGHAVPTIEQPEQAVLLEAHIRDFSIRDENTSVSNRGKYNAFTETGSGAMTYLSEMSNAGVTHFHMLPANDIATIEEDVSKRIDLQNTVGELCARNSAAPVCGVESNSDTLLSVLESYSADTDDAKKLVESFRGFDGFNWGYDPHHFNTVEGSYASTPEGVARIKEFRGMVLALHETGLRVILDVVYNHTSASGIYDNSVFDKLVPGYYHRYNEVTGIIENSTCCDNVATEHKMMSKFVVDSLVHWAQHYGMDGFRFDVMGHLPAQLLLDGRAAVAAIDADTYFYGEGWNLGEVANDRLFKQATQYNLADTQIGTFNDRPRDSIREQALSITSPDLNKSDHIRLGLAGTLQNFELEDKSGVVKKGINFDKSSYGLDPADIINYVSKHDNETLYDYLQYNFDDSTTAATRARVHMLSAAIPLMSQGIPFFQLGVDKIRSKSMDRNTYDAGDWFNYVDYTNNSNNWNVGLPIERDGQYNVALSSNPNAQVAMTDIQQSSAVFKEFLKIRTGSPLFSLTTEQDVINRVGFHNTGSTQTAGVIVMSIDDGIGLTDLDSNFDAIVVVINGTAVTQDLDVKSASGFVLHDEQLASADLIVKTASFSEDATNGTFTVPGHTVAVFVKPQTGAQGEGLATDPDRVASPYNETVIGIEGLNEIEFTALEYDQRGTYSGSVTLEPGTYEFNLGDATLSIENIAFADVSIGANSETIVAGNTDSFAVTVTQSGAYSVSLNVESSTPVLSIEFDNACALQNAETQGPFDVAGDGYLYVKGDHSAWNAVSDYQLKYKGNNVYQAVANFDGAMAFKLASSDGNWSTQLWVQNNDGSINTSNLVVGTSYDVAYGNAGTDNNSTTLAAGVYSFKLTLNESNPTQGQGVGTLLIEQCSN
ncbi:alpha-1,6-glucosidase domain-containing protein [Psychrosphaera aestuarii]|uniref:alpha-1,6-glucosidase domain-containing protein n=1 Tax=Psychrosphaera aestuarii TaxID=1266052 RepID=UPI001B31C84A|nr:alpha-1,6-glucosidase domain-containing protein [Psychrosphaera aestuarii]